MISSWLNRSHKNQCHQFGTPNNISATLSGVALFVVDEAFAVEMKCLAILELTIISQYS